MRGAREGGGAPPLRGGRFAPPYIRGGSRTREGGVPRPWRDGTRRYRRTVSPARGGGRRRTPPARGGGGHPHGSDPIPTLRANLASRIAGLFARTDAKIRVSDFCPVRGAKIRALTREGRFSVISDLTREGRFSATFALKRTREGCDLRTKASLTGKVASPAPGGTGTERPSRGVGIVLSPPVRGTIPTPREGRS